MAFLRVQECTHGEVDARCCIDHQNLGVLRNSPDDCGILDTDHDWTVTRTEM